MKNVKVQTQTPDSPLTAHDSWLKCTFKGIVKMVKLTKNLKISDLKIQLENMFNVKDITVSYKDSKGDLVVLQSDDLLQYLVLHSKSRTIDIYISEPNNPSNILIFFSKLTIIYRCN